MSGGRGPLTFPACLRRRCATQDALTQCIFGGGMLPPNPGGVDKAYEEEVRRGRALSVCVCGVEWSGAVDLWAVMCVCVCVCVCVC